MPDYSDHKEVLSLLKEAQDAEYEIREKCIESKDFIYKDDGQWEQSVTSRMSGRPKYTFDLVTPVIDQITGGISNANFGIKVKPVGTVEDKNKHKLIEDIVRGIESRSSASTVYSSAARNMIIAGISGWRVETDWLGQDSFEQDIIVSPIHNFENRVWFDPNFERQDASDAEYCFVMQSMTPERFKELYPDSVESSLESGQSNYGCGGHDSVMVGEILYKVRSKRDLVLMSNGAVYEDDENFKKISDELAAVGVTEARRRTAEKCEVKTRVFSDSAFLSEERDTPFSALPVIPTFADFTVLQNGNHYKGLTARLMDAQRVYNYAKSREIEEGALSPKQKMIMTPEQAAGHETELATMNVNNDAYQLYNHHQGVPTPSTIGGSQINPGLARVSDDAAMSINKIAGMFSSNMGDNPGLQSGVAIDLQQRKGDNGVAKYYQSQEVAIRQTARVIIDAIPKVYDSKRVLTVVGEDGKSREETVNDVAFDTQTSKKVELNNLSRGSYDVAVSAGTSYQGRQQETVKAITEIAAIDPTVLQVGADVLLSNISAPGVDTLAKRVRNTMVLSGSIPEDQLTDEEMATVAAIQQQQAEAQANQVDPAQAIAQAELEKAQAETADTISKIEEREAKMEMTRIEALLKTQQQQFENILAESKAKMAELQAEADVMKTIREAMGSKVNMVTEESVEAFNNQAEQVVDTQEDILEGEVDNLLGVDRPL